MLLDAGEPSAAIDIDLSEGTGDLGLDEQGGKK
jgi:hypothetical protein